MQEHELIVEVLASLQAMAEKLEAGATVPRQDVADFGRFFRDFADKCHHGKEEDRLFVKMVEAGFPQDSGPVAVMLAEHDEGREEVRGLLAVGSGAGPLSDPERAEDQSSTPANSCPCSTRTSRRRTTSSIPWPKTRSLPRNSICWTNPARRSTRRSAAKLNVAELKQLASRLAQRYPADSADLRYMEAVGTPAPVVSDRLRGGGRSSRQERGELGHALDIGSYTRRRGCGQLLSARELLTLTGTS